MVPPDKTCPDPGSYSRAQRLRISHATASAVAVGLQTHRISLASTASPRGEKNRAPMGDTAIGRHGKKYRVVSHGDRIATPRPPSVHMSRRPWDAVARKSSVHVRPHDRPAPRVPKVTTVARAAAATSECDRPRCPIRLPY